MDNRGTRYRRGESPIVSPTSNSRSSSVHEDTAPKPRSPSPACIGKFGLRRSHSGAQRRKGSKVASSTAVEPAESLSPARGVNEPVGPRPSKRSQSRDITADGLTGSREGRHFTVGNVGQNGKIYLRYLLSDSGFPPVYDTLCTHSMVNLQASSDLQPSLSYPWPLPTPMSNRKRQNTTVYATKRRLQIQSLVKFPNVRSAAPLHSS